jgi:hypothetical protein
MKTIAIAVLVLLCSNLCQAQNFREWFRQNATQKDYLIEQIAQLKVYLELTEKGYKIAKEGLDIIGQIKEGEFKLHKNRFDSLLIVNPKVGSSSRLQQITDLHGRVNDTCEKLPSELGPVFNPGQLAYIEWVLKLVYDDCQSVINNLFLVIRNGNLSMSDDQRIERIELGFRQMQDNYSFVKSFDQKTKLLAAQIRNENAEIGVRKTIHSLN